MIELSIHVLEKALHVMSATAMILLSLLIVVDVTLRYIFSAPIFGSDELGTYLFGIIVIAGLGLVSQERSHIVVNLLEDQLKNHAAAMTHVLFEVFNVVGIAFVAFVLARHSLRLIEVEQRSMVLGLPIGVIAAYMSVTAVFGIVIVIYSILRAKLA